MNAKSGLHAAAVVPWLVDDEVIEVGEVPADAAALDALCLCGHMKGEHLARPPHDCEGDGPMCECPGYQAAAPDAVARRDTLVDALSAPATLIDDLAGFGGAAE
jgi:hypothetical protein